MDMGSLEQCKSTSATWRSLTYPINLKTQSQNIDIQMQVYIVEYVRWPIQNNLSGGRMGSVNLDHGRWFDPRSGHTQELWIGNLVAASQSALFSGQLSTKYEVLGPVSV